MKTQFIKSNISGLPQWAKGIIAIAVVGGVAIVSYMVYKKIKKEKEDREQKINIKNEIEEAIKRGLKKSFPDSQYVSKANQIYEGMKYGIGDDYGSVRDILMTMKNDLDVLSIMRAFGKRQAYVLGIPQGEPKDLFTFVRAELGNEYAGLTSYKMDAINKDWAKKGIKYKF
jgi:hypothetical protein